MIKSKRIFLLTDVPQEREGYQIQEGQWPKTGNLEFKNV
jgi:hypothetical protein